MMSLPAWDESPRVFFDSWSGLARVVLVGVPAYAALVVFIRLSGKRTLAKMNAFDLVVTVALGSTLASILTSTEVALAEGLVALALLVLLQLLVAWGAGRSSRFEALVKASPVMLFYRGDFLGAALRLSTPRTNRAGSSTTWGLASGTTLTRRSG
ncbi:MAG: DUF421 domain-containing protein [Planctomycetota bacterium]|nr:DUF421 domain-containing protein [Planctomycetota bacterium]